MKLRHPLLFLLAVCINFTSSNSAATNQYWNVGGAGGDGIWGTGPGDKNWNLTAGAATGNTTWADPTDDVAVFQDGLGGTVTVFDPVQTNGLSQTGANYTLDAGVITLVPDAATDAPFVNVQTGTLTVNSVLAGTSGLVKTGAANLLLTNANPFTGPAAINAGTLTLTGSLASTSVGIAAGATLTDVTGGLAPATVLSTAGTLTVNAADTIASLTNTAGTVNGSGPLTVTGPTVFTGGTLAAPLTLNGTGGGTFTNAILAGTFHGTAALDGATVSGTLNGPTISTGNTLVSGSIGGGSLDVTGLGTTFTLTGSSANLTVNIATGATLMDSNGGLDASAVLTNAGTLTVNAADTITTYIQSNTGSLTGTGVLTASGLATLDGGTVSGNLLGNTTSTGDVFVSGSLGGGSLDVNGGVLTLTGIATNTPITIAAPATLVDANGGLANTAALTNAGILTINAADSIASLTNNAGTVNGTGTLTVTGATIFTDGTLAAPLTIIGSGGTFTNATLAGTFNGTTALDGATVSGTVGGNTTSTGNVLVSGSLGGGSLNVNGGILTLTGTSTNAAVNLAAGAGLIDQNGGLAANTGLINRGTLTVNAADSIATYTQHATGILNGTAVLTANTATLTGGTVAGQLTATTLTSNGPVALTGSVLASTIGLTSDTLTNTGTLTATTLLNLAAGSRLVANGSQSYPLLTTAGLGAATWQGNLANPTTVAPGGIGSVGHLVVTGHFANAPAGLLKLDLGTGVRDLVTVGGTATFGGTLDLNQLSPIAPFVPVQVVAAGGYAGNFTALTENLDGSAWFNPADGTVMTLATPPTIGGTLWGTTANQTSAWVALYDDVIAPGTTNITYSPAGGYEITGGIADAGNPDLLNALSASFVPGGLDSGLLNRLSPEVYASFQDYAIEATRAHQRAALDAPSLGFIQPPNRPDAKDAKHALPAAPAANAWEYFAALEYFDAGTDSSPNQADYDLSGFGFIAGARTSLSDTVRIGGYLAADDGTVEGSLIDGDSCGWSLGLFAKALVHARTHTLLTGGLSYGKYQFEGTRGSLIANGTGWTPASIGFSDVDSDALEFYLGASSLAYQTDRFRLIPSFGLRYVTGSRDGFAEAAGGPGSPIALVVGEDAYHSALAELSLRAEADLTAAITAHGLLGFRAAITDDPAALSARFATGSRPQRATAAGLDGDAVFVGLGATWRIRDDLALGLHWRADFRSDADPENNLSLSTSFRF